MAWLASDVVNVFFDVHSVPDQILHEDRLGMDPFRHRLHQDLKTGLARIASALEHAGLEPGQFESPAPRPGATRIFNEELGVTA